MPPARTRDLPTLQMVTLRRLLPASTPPLVFDRAAPLATVEAALRDAPAAIAILVDGAGVLQGTLGLGDLPADADRHAPAAAVMATHTVAMAPEDELETARRALGTHGVDRVLVVTTTGDLLGVLTSWDLERATLRRRRVAVPDRR